MRLALFEPDIPQNAGTLMRLGACLNVAVDIIEPCGFVFDERRMRRAGMDYLDQVDLTRHTSWVAYLKGHTGRLILLTTQAKTSYTDFKFQPDDTVLLGRESAGVPDEVHKAADARITVPMAIDARSLNVAVAAAMVLGEGLRQTDGFPVISKEYE
ncbi:MAG: tRNA (cytidine(34)-2'-O)-methyltransferase [Rhodospirillaceae bacterium]|jgi:tRNA (cytidine/uridine-2'-O-)-methyltransferase|nr:tRNA (cytidine(34)-2'-O)-methyltransferase [Rhodospirillaceae bacterium]